jgi:hypothetical protein
MATGIVFGTVQNRAGDPFPEIRAVLDTIHVVGGANRYARGLPVTALSSTVSCPPYGIGDTTDDDGRCALFYDWPGTHIGDVLANCRFRVMCFDDERLSPFIGADHRIGGVIGLDLRAIIGQVLPLSPTSADSWLNFIADRMRALPRASGFGRGILGDRMSTDQYSIAICVDVTATR